MGGGMSRDLAWYQRVAEALHSDVPWPAVHPDDMARLVECPKCGAVLVLDRQSEHAEYHRTSDGGGF